MKRRLSRKRRSTRGQKKRSSKTRRFLRRRQNGGANLPVPEGSVIGVNLDPKDAYTVPVLVSKNLFEDEILDK